MCVHQSSPSSRTATCSAAWTRSEQRRSATAGTRQYWVSRRASSSHRRYKCTERSAARWATAFYSYSCQAFCLSSLCVFFVLWAYIQEIQQELEGSKFDIIGRALSGLLRWIDTIERSSASLRTPSGHFRMCSNKIITSNSNRRRHEIFMFLYVIDQNDQRLSR